MELTEMLLDFQNTLDRESMRTQKPRKTGITMVLVMDVANQGPDYIAPYQGLIDRIKLLDTLWHHDPGIVERTICAYRDMQMDVAMGGTQFEIAKAQGKMSQYLDLLERLGVNEVEVENHASGASLEETRDEIAMLKDRGFTVVGEVGKKWAWQDPTRASRDLVHVDKVVELAGTMLEAGADYLYWEGMVVRNLIGTQLENTEGQAQFLDVTRQVNSDDLIFEIWDARNMGNHPIIAWLVQQLGPNVNLANIFPMDVKWVEWIRHGIIYEMDHPYMRWSQDRLAAEHWWQMEAPDYGIDMQRNFQLKD
jgi:phosphosulfolactate synthase